MTNTTQRDPLPFTLLVLTFATGLVDAVSFLGLGHVFTANMTGNVVFLAFATAGAPGLSFERSLLALVSFLLGAVAGGRLGVALVASTRRRWLLTAAVTEGALVLVAACCALGYATEALPHARQTAVIVLTGLAMGFRNATVRRLAVPDLNTTVLTLTLTGLAADSSLAGGANPRMWRRMLSAVLMFLGAVSGAYLLRWGIAPPLFLMSVLVLLVTLLYAWHPAAAQPVQTDAQKA